MKYFDVISFGAGVQSTALLLMACDGTLEKMGYNIKHAIFANTGDEPKRVLDHYYKMEEYAKEFGITLHMVKNGNIVDDVKHFCKTGERVPSLPYFTKDLDTGEKGMLMRQCTNDYKIVPVDKYIKRMVGVEKGQRFPKDLHVRKLIGISIDEFQRIKESPHKWHSNHYPLFDMEWDRLKCMNYINETLGYTPTSSECVICPFHSDDYWRNMKLNYIEDWKHAVEIDNLLRSSNIQDKTKIKNELYLYRMCVPLEKAELNENQLSLFDMFCGGGCGL